MWNLIYLGPIGGIYNNYFLNLTGHTICEMPRKVSLVASIVSLLSPEIPFYEQIFQ